MKNYTVKTTRGDVLLHTDDIQQARAMLEQESNVYIQYNKGAIREQQTIRNQVSSALFKALPVFFDLDMEKRIVDINNGVYGQCSEAIILYRFIDSALRLRRERDGTCLVPSTCMLRKIPAN